MLKKKIDSKVTMLEHSLAKVELFQRYWTIYLNILHRVHYINKIYLFDLFAGEGIYDNGEKGSPIVAAEAIKAHYFTNGKTIKNIRILLNDNGKSEIDKGELKIERLKRLFSTIYQPENVKILFKSCDYSEIINFSIRTLNNMTKSSRALLFIDPYGYKEIHIAHLNQLLKNQKTEIILFLPVSFMYRFAAKALNTINEYEFPGGRPLKIFLDSLFGNIKPNLSNISTFINSLKEQFKAVVSVEFVDTFIIERDCSNIFCLFFFSNNFTGYKKMLETKWSMDEQNGRGFSLDHKQQSLFGWKDIHTYPRDLENILKEKRSMTNHELRDYGYKKGYLPKHTKEILTNLHERDVIEVRALDGGSQRSFYIPNEKRNIEIVSKI